MRQVLRASRHLSSQSFDLLWLIILQVEELLDKGNLRSYALPLVGLMPMCKTPTASYIDQAFLVQIGGENPPRPREVGEANQRVDVRPLSS